MICGFSLRHLQNVGGHFDGRHYDLARQISSYFVNFIKTGNPNGNDSNGNELPKWQAYTEENRYEMNFKTKGASGGNTETARNAIFA